MGTRKRGKSRSDTSTGTASKKPQSNDSLDAVYTRLAVLVMFLVGLGALKFMHNRNRGHSYPVVDTNKPTHLMVLARLGNAKLVRRILNRVDKQELNTVDTRDLPAIVYALEGRQNTIMFPSTEGKPESLRGDHETVVEMIASHSMFDSSIGCPLYYAVNFRNIPAMRTLLKYSNRNALLSCIREHDAHDDTAIHVASRSKAAGMSRLFAITELAAEKYPKMISKDGAFDSEKLKLVGANFRRNDTTKKRVYTRKDLVTSLTTEDLEMLLQLDSAKDTLSLKAYKGYTPLHVAASSGSLAIVELLLQYGADPNILDGHGRTPLHISTSRGFVEIVKRLLSLTSLDVVDQSNLSVLDIACLLGAHEIVKVLLQAIAGNKELGSLQSAITSSSASKYCNSTIAVQSMTQFPLVAQAFGEYGITTNLNANNLHESEPNRFVAENKGEQWSEEELPVANNTTQSCPITRIHAKSLSSEEFVRDYLDLNRFLKINFSLPLPSTLFRPVIITGLLDDWPARQSWTKSEFIKRYGNVRMSVSSIPYASTYGLESSIANATAKEFILKYMSNNNKRTQSRPPYIFDAGVLHMQQNMQTDAPIPPSIMDRLLLAQFILGPRGSGAYPHFHNAAVNALVHGKKKWWLYPPSEAFFEIKHVTEWLENGFSLTSGFECVQHSGEVFFVPDQWGHAVLNIRDSIAVAYEFHE
eukprot:m.76810 g.76810  ORF g.76810 m.76810 type:complete len:699 (-) comp12582_c0_seq3:68-2164(-)